MKLRHLIPFLCAMGAVLSPAWGGLPANRENVHAMPKPEVLQRKGFGDEYKGEALYTQPDASAGGGIRLTAPAPLLGAYAIPQSNQHHIYKGTISNGNQVAFQGLPVAKYDLVLHGSDKVFEGVVLNRDDNNLTEKDLKFIDVTVKRNIPFFDLKHIHRIKGTIGKAGKATALTQDLRPGRSGIIVNQNDEVMVGFQIRSIKLQFIEDVGVAGWQVLQTREIIRQSVHPEMHPKDLIPIEFSEKISNIRVTDSVKDLGAVMLP